MKPLIRHPFRGVVLVVSMLGACSGQSMAPTGPTSLDSPDSGALAAGAVGTESPARITTADAPASRPSAANFELTFMTDMIDHHHMAIMMADMCIAKAVHEELRALCEQVKAAQMAEIEQMQAWLVDWYGISYEPVMKPAGQNMMDRLAALSGDAFEIAFMEMMIKHHSKAIKEGRHCLDKAAHAELRALCEDIISTQSAEIAQMQAWLCAWYGECR